MSLKLINKHVELEIRRTFSEKSNLLGITVILDIHFIDNPPIVGEAIYGEAFPFEKPPRVWLEVFAPDVTREKIVEIICHELIHIKYPYLRHEDREFLERVEDCKKL